MDFGQSIKTCFSKFVDFSGRGRRSEYWWFYLFNVILSIVTGWIPIAGQVIALVMLIPSLAAGSRRLHDTDRSGWWQALPIGLLAIGGILFAVAFAADQNNPNPVLLILGGIGLLAGIVTLIILIVWLATDTQPGPNRFGPSPK